MRAIRANRLKPAIRRFWPPEARSAKTGVQFGNAKTIRENQAIRANLRIDSRESGHLSFPTRYRENGHFEALPLRVAIFPASLGENRISQGVEEWGSLISVP